MSRKHFILIAAAIKSISNIAERENVALLMANVCRQSNPNFNASRFYDACEVSNGN